jgi:ribosomal protein S27E
MNSVDKLPIDDDNLQETRATSVISKKVNLNKHVVDNEFVEKLNEYYKLKHEYETKKLSQKNSILKDTTLNMKRKQDKYKRMKVNCINCGRNVGTIFENDSGILSAVCGDKLAPCKLDIKIDRGKFLSLENLIDVFQNGVDEMKEKIISTKLDLLFGYEPESVVLKKFGNLKNELTEDLEAVMGYRTHFIETVSNLDNKSELNSKMTMFYNKIALIKSTIAEFNEMGQIQLIKDMVSMYDTELLPLLDELRKLKYKYMAMEYDADTDTHRLVRNVFTLQEMTVPFDNPSVDSFIVGTNKTQKKGTGVLRDEYDDDMDDNRYRE